LRNIPKAFAKHPKSPCVLFQREAENVEITIVKTQISIVLTAGLLMAGVAAASATEMQQFFGRKTSSSVGQQYTYSQHNIYAGHSNSKVQHHAAVARAPWHNAD
jgi:hypothetical protein